MGLNPITPGRLIYIVNNAGQKHVTSCVSPDVVPSPDGAGATQLLMQLFSPTKPQPEVELEKKHNPFAVSPVTVPGYDGGIDQQPDLQLLPLVKVQVPELYWFHV